MEKAGKVSKGEVIVLIADREDDPNHTYVMTAAQALVDFDMAEALKTFYGVAYDPERGDREPDVDQPEATPEDFADWLSYTGRVRATGRVIYISSNDDYDDMRATEGWY
jgi:hypothetical protein